MDSDPQLLASHLNSVLVVDKTASALLRHMYHTIASIQEVLLHFPVQFAPGLIGMLESLQPPSPNRPMECTVACVDLRKSWAVYLQFLAHDDDVFVHTYCGSSVGARGAFGRTGICNVGFDGQSVN
jgi:hypothetical protein